MQLLVQKKIDKTANILIGASVAVVFIAVVTIGGELYTPIKDWLAGVFSHHWIGKGILTMLVFVIASILPYTREATVASLARLTAVLFFISLCSALAIAGFFGYEIFIK
ncbi:MAG: hypothetical protein HYT28_02020 [Parcubacteria group bacterium]|nr:hypothetical protein [Parcubacteria group bacterium]